jgi:hypothetical protein
MVDDPARKQNALVATPAKRDQVIERLQDHYAHNHLEVQDFELLVEKAERARTDGELMLLLEGLPDLAGQRALVPASAGRVTTSVKAIFGEANRAGPWRVPATVRVRALFGNVVLDLSEAELGRAETLIEVHATFGNVRIAVPEGLAVDCDGAAILGSFEHLAQGAATQRDPRRVHIVGRAVFGNVEIVVVKKKPVGVLAGLKNLLLGR